MNKIIFLDLDGVLNSQKTFMENHEYHMFFCKYQSEGFDDIVKNRMLEIDFDKVYMLIDICNLTGAKIVVSSSWRRLYDYPLIEEKLVFLGLPIVGVTPFIDGHRRGDEIRKYLEENEVDDFVILDDDRFSDFNELENYLIKTSFYDDGLTEEIASDVVRVLRRT